MNFHIHIPTQLFWIAGGIVVGLIIGAISIRLSARDIIGRFLNW